MNKLWYKNAVIYSLDIATFKDANRDGVGDLRGLKHRLNYLAGLGIDCIWLLPFYDSPNKDNGYDIRDYYKIDDRIGDFGEFAELVDIAEEKGIRILVDLVVNHTSDQHPWFQEARKNKNSPYRDYYIWSSTKPKNHNDHVMFGHHQGDTNWHFDKEAGAYYYHTFYPHQPDLNMTNPVVREEIKRIMHFWLKLGISGFRLDAVPHLVRKKGEIHFEGDPHDILRDLRDFVEGQKKEAVLLAEVDVEPERYKDFFGEEDQMNLLLNFYVDNYIFLSLARESAQPLQKALKKLPQLHAKEQYATFLRNHDELDLERLTHTEREEVYQVFAPEEDMRIFGRGIRRRIAPMLENNRQKLELAFSLLFSLPGSPVIWYGQEIGMGENLSRKGRDSVRTWMQWSSDSNGGFTEAEISGTKGNTISKGEFSYKQVNVRDQQMDPHSLLNWMRRAISFRKESPEFGWGAFEVVKTDNKNVLAHCCRTKDGAAIAVHNFSAEEQQVALDLRDLEGFMDMFGDKVYDPFDSNKNQLFIRGYGYRWLCRRQN